MTKALVTGGTGFLGTRLVEELLRRDCQVRVMARGPRSHEILDVLPVEWAYAALDEPDALAEAMQGCDVVFHTAGVVSYNPQKAQLMQETNVQGTANVAKAALAAGVQRLVHTSSSAAIGINTDPEKTMNEDTEFNARPTGMAYFTTKYDAEQELHKLRDEGLDYVIVNPGSIIGPRDTRKKGQVYAGLIARLNPRILPPGGNNFVGVEDVIQGHMLAWERGRSGERYILGGENLAFADLIIKVNQILGRKPPSLRLPLAAMKLVSGGLRLMRALGKEMHISPELVANIGSWYLFLDHSKATRELGYAPEPLEKALRVQIEWLRAEKYI